MLQRDRQRLTRILEYCEDINAAISRFKADFEVFQQDLAYQHSVAFCILQIGELVGSLSDEYRRATMESIPWNQIKGMRNIVVHDYGDIDLEVVWDTAINGVPTLKEFCEEQLSSISD